MLDFVFGVLDFNLDFTFISITADCFKPWEFSRTMVFNEQISQFSLQIEGKWC